MTKLIESARKLAFQAHGDQRRKYVAALIHHAVTLLVTS